jgi:predicted RNase H-like HicB family nuclease
MRQGFTAIIQREGEGYVALCPGLDIASQADTIESALQNLYEALELFFECAAPEEVERRCSNEVYVTQVDVDMGEVPRRR